MHSPNLSLDVYARSFVPETLRVINTLSGIETNTPAGRQIDFGAYASRWTGSDMLPRPRDPIELSMIEPQTLSDTVLPSQYELFFRHLLQQEFSSQSIENEGYALYGHDVSVEVDAFGPGE